MNLKKCPRCATKKTITEFNSNRNTRDGLDAYCKLCRKRINKDHGNLHPEYKKRAEANMRSKYRIHNMFGIPLEDIDYSMISADIESQKFISLVKGSKHAIGKSTVGR